MRKEEKLTAGKQSLLLWREEGDIAFWKEMNEKASWSKENGESRANYFKRIVSSNAKGKR